MKALIFLTTIAGIFLCSSGVYGQNQIAGAINTDLTTRKIVTTPQLQRPKEVVESGLGGNVRVKVTVDDDGNVTSVDDVVGPGAVCRRVSRADVVAMRNSAKEAAATAKFEPASHTTGTAFSTWLNFNFPGSDEVSDFDAARQPQADGKMYTVVGDRNYEVAEAPSEYRGPVKAAANTKSDPAAAPKTISGGVLNGRAIELPKPPYPPAARAVRAEGAVSIQVLIDENGEVFSGKGSFRSSAPTIGICHRSMRIAIRSHPTCR